MTTDTTRRLNVNDLAYGQFHCQIFMKKIRLLPAGFNVDVSGNL